MKFSLAASTVSIITGLTLGFHSLQHLDVFNNLDDAPQEEADMMAETVVDSSPETSPIFFSEEILLFLGLGMISFSVLVFAYGITIRKLGEEKEFVN